MPNLMQTLLLAGAEVAAGFVLGPAGMAGMGELFAGENLIAGRLVQDGNGIRSWSLSDPGSHERKSGPSTAAGGPRGRG